MLNRLNRNTAGDRAAFRAEMISAARPLAAADRQAVVVRICQGDPYCPLVGEQCQRAQLAGCRFCEVILVQPDGSIEVDDPGKRIG